MQSESVYSLLLSSHSARAANTAVEITNNPGTGGQRAIVVKSGETSLGRVSGVGRDWCDALTPATAGLPGY